MLSNGSYWQGKISSQAENFQDFIFICQSETNSVVMYLSLLIISECGSITPTQVLTISPISTQCQDLNLNGPKMYLSQFSQAESSNPEYEAEAFEAVSV